MIMSILCNIKLHKLNKLNDVCLIWIENRLIILGSICSKPVIE